jgi:hypothetical protein
MSDLQRVVSELGQSLGLSAPTSDSELAAARRAVGRQIPAELEEYWRRGGFASSIGQINFFSRKDFLDVAHERKLHPADHLPSAIYVASDGGDGWFFVDADGSLGHGAGAVFWTDRALRIPSRIVPVGETIARFLAAIGAGRRPWSGPNLRAIEMTTLKAALDRHRDRWRGSPPVEKEALRDASERIGARFPVELEELLGIADGMALPDAGVTIYSQDYLAPVDGTLDRHGQPGAIWFAEEPSGARFAVTLPGWREPDGGQVIRVQPEQGLQQTPLLGPLPRVIVKWLEQGKSDGQGVH